MLTLQLSTISARSKQWGILRFESGERKTELKLYVETLTRDNQLEKATAQILKTIARHYVNHRKRMITEFGAVDTPQKRAAIGDIIHMLDRIKKHNHLATAINILRFMPKFYAIMPGRVSMYYEEDLQQLNHLFDTCKSIIENAEALKKQA
jgi:hypothetical protein